MPSPVIPTHVFWIPLTLTFSRTLLPDCSPSLLHLPLFLLYWIIPTGIRRLSTIARLWTIFPYLLFPCSPFLCSVHNQASYKSCQHSLSTLLPAAHSSIHCCLASVPSISLKLFLSRFPVLSVLTRPSTVDHSFMKYSSFFGSTIPLYPDFSLCILLSPWSFSILQTSLLSTSFH